MQAPFAAIPAVPAAVGLLCGILAAMQPACPAPAVAAALCAALGAGLWVWRRTRFFAAAPLAMAAGLMLGTAAAADTRPARHYDEEPGVLARAVYASPLEGDAAAFVAATLVADGRYMSRALRDDFRNAGMAHVLALSGFHVGVIAMLAMGLTAPMLLVRRWRRWRILPVAAAVWAFACAGGLAPSLQRAALMFTLLLLARHTGRHYSTLNALAVAAIAILLLRPAAAADPGFALSFAAVAGIVLLMPALNPVDASRRPRMHGAVAMLALPVSATLATAPIVAALFGRLPLLFLPANVVLSLLFAPFYLLAMLVVALSAAGLSLTPLTAAVNALYGLMASTAEACSSAVAVDFPPAATAAFYACLALLAAMPRMGRRNQSAPLYV